MRVVVVGAGIVGASVALHLAAAGTEVVVVDDDRPGRATRAGAGIVAPPWRRDQGPDALFNLRAAAFDAYPDLMAQLGPGNFFDVIGLLYTAPPGPALEAVYAAVLATRSAGGGRLGEIQLLEPLQAAGLFPYLRPDLGAVALPTAGRVDGEAVRQGLLRTACQAGAQLVSGPAALDSHGDRVTGVTVGGLGWAADAVVVAAGAWSAGLLRPLGVELALDAQRGQILHLVIPGARTDRMAVVQPIGADHYLLPFPDSRVVVGATRETGSGFDPRLTAGGVAHVLGDALGVAPGLATATLSELRVGLRPASRDGLPFLGAVTSRPGLFVATGMGPEGLTLGPLCGRAVADAVLGKDPGIDLAPFAPERPSS